MGGEKPGQASGRPSMWPCKLLKHKHRFRTSLSFDARGFSRALLTDPEVQ